MIHVRELPPLRLHYEIETPNGRSYRWGGDEPNPANVPSGGSDSSTMPGGYEQLDVTLPRKAGTDYTDLDRLSTIRARGAGGAIAWEGRLERTPRVSGDQMAISPSAVGWQAHLDDDKSAAMIYIDRDLSRWGAGSAQRRVNLASAWRVTDSSAASDDGGLPGLMLTIQLNGGVKPIAETWYDAGAGALVGRVLYSWRGSNLGVASGDANWNASIFSSNDDIATTTEASTNLLATSTSGTAGSFTLTTARRYALIDLLYNATTSSSPDVDRILQVYNLAVIGNHSLGLYGTVTAGIRAAEIVAHAVGRWAPLLQIDDTVQPSDFLIPHLAFHDPTTAGEIVRQATAFGLQDWGVWDDQTFYWAQRGTYGRKWRARIAPAQLSETGPQLDRLWESVIVSYIDVDGSTRTVGPIGSGADTEDAILHDTDPENPANQLGIIRRDLLSMGTSTAAGAIELGRRFLEEQKLLDTSGQAQLVGHVMDDRGVLHPYWRVRAGDTISFIDASDTSERRIVRASHDHDSRTCTVDLDAPPEGLDALLARLGVVLVPLGVGA